MQLRLFDWDERLSGRFGCRIVKIGKRRDGGNKYWCFEHRADATGKYGVQASECRYAHVAPIIESETFQLALEEYEGGVGIWGAVPPIYDTTELGMDRGIHIHARRKSGGPKEIDATFRRVKVYSKIPIAPESPLLATTVDELDAIYFMVSSIFGMPLAVIECPHCSHSHLDRDWFAVHPHRTHLCSGCGRNFKNGHAFVGNPASMLRNLVGGRPSDTVRSRGRLRIQQRDYPGGLRIWGSNPAILWTSQHPQEEGIHIHAYEQSGAIPTIDGTFGTLEIDGKELDGAAVRLLMAQSALPHLFGRVISLTCDACGTEYFDQGDSAFTLRQHRNCGSCGHEVKAGGRRRKVISNPTIRVMEELALGAPRMPAKSNLGLIPEVP